MKNLISTLNQIGQLKRRMLLGAFAIFCLVSTTVAQQVWPVQISGYTIAPRSLDLGVYANERSQDLVFNAILNDPVKPTLEVRLSLSIEQNGEIIYQTDPNFLSAPLTLTQFQLENLDGSMLQSYLNVANLTDASGTGVGSLEIPEGFNQICVQVYGVERNVPVSNKFCVQGSFVLNQPPQAIIPENGEKIKFPETQNQLFSWQPMHLGSSNPPGAVEYGFELVELPEGTYNANDAFESSLQVYRTTTMIPSLIYTQAEPQLESNKIYAWRVKAASVTARTSKLFQNDGYSEVYTFAYYDDEEPGIDISSFNNPSPVGCEVFNTDFGPISNAEPIGISLVESDKVAMGYFTMEIIDAVGGAAGFNGTGKVPIPMFNTKINVAFSGLKVNSEMRVYEAEEIKAVVDLPFGLSNTDLAIENIQNNIDEDYFVKLYEYFSFGSGESKFKSKMSMADPQAVNLPIAMDQPDLPYVSVIDINFTPRNAFLNLASWESLPSGEALQFAATAVQATPYGVKNKSHLILLNETTGGTSTNIVESISLSSSGGLESRMNCDCNGAGDLEIEKSIQVSTEIIVDSYTGGSIVLTPKKGKTTETYVGDLKNLQDFMIVGLDDFNFKPKSAKLDLGVGSKVTTPDNIKNEYKSSSNDDWRGIIFAETELEIPEAYNIFDKDNSIILDNGSLVIDEEKVAFGKFSRRNYLPMGRKKMGPWPISVDDLSLEINDGTTNGLSVGGQIMTPVFKDPFTYSGFISNNNFDEIGIDAVVPIDELNMDLWKASFNPEENSFVSGKIVNINDQRSIVPKANFTGEISIELTDDQFVDYLLGNAAQSNRELKQVLDIDKLKFNLNSLKLNGFELNPFELPGNRYEVDSIDFKNAQIEIGDVKHNLEDAKIIYQEGGNNETEKLGLELIVVHENNKIKLTFWSEKKGEQFEFEGIEAVVLELKCNCHASVVVPSKDGLGLIIDEFIDSEFDHLFENMSTGSLSSNGITLDQAKVNIELRKRLKTILTSKAVSGFPIVEDEQLNIPFLNKNLDVELKNGRYEGSYRDTKFATEKIEWNDDLFNALDNPQSGDLKLPIVINKDNWSNFGFKKGFNIPDHSRLIITEFKTATQENKLDNAHLSLMIVTQIPKEGKTNEFQYASFKHGFVPVGPKELSLANLHLDLVQDVKLNDQITFYRRSNDHTSYDYSRSLSKQSYTSVNCDEGLEFFNVQGIYDTPNGSIFMHETQSDGRNKLSKDAARFGFTMFYKGGDNVTNPFNQFIAVISSNKVGTNGSTKPWAFSTEDAGFMSFSPGKKLIAYLDYDTDRVVEKLGQYDSQSNDYAAGYKSSFKGLVFKEMQFEIADLQMSKSGSLKLPITNVFFDHNEGGLHADYDQKDVVLKEADARLGSWHYTLSDMYFNIDGNYFDDRELEIKGETRIPIFTADTRDDNWSKRYTKGWTEFNLKISYDYAIDRMKVTGSFGEIASNLYELHYIHGLGMKIDEGSAVNIYFNETQNRFVSQLEISGRAIYRFEDPAITIPTFKFQNLKVNHSTTGLCRSESGTNGIETLEFGTWSVKPFSPTEVAALSKAKTKMSGAPTAKDKTGKTVRASGPVSTGANKGARGKANKGLAKVDQFAEGLGGLKDKVTSFIGLDMNIHEPVFSCTGNDWRLNLGLEISFVRDKNSTTDKKGKAFRNNKKKYGNANEGQIKQAKQAEASMANAEKTYKAKQDAVKDAAAELKALKKGSQIFKKNKQSYSKEREEAVQKNIAAAQKKLDDAIAEVKSAGRALPKARSAADKIGNSIAKTNKQKLGTGKQIKNSFKEAKAAKTGAFSAGGNLDIVFNKDKFLRVEPKCFLLGGEFGPAKFGGGINYMKPNTDKPEEAKWGQSVVGMIEFFVMGMGFEAKFQAGKKYKSADDGFRYFFADLMAYFGNTMIEPHTQIRFDQLGGGMYFNMERVEPPGVELAEVDEAQKKSKTAKGTLSNERKTGDNNGCRTGGDKLAPGKSLSGFTYKVKEGGLGGYISAGFSHALQPISGVGTISMAFDYKELAFKEFRLGADLYAFYLYKGNLKEDRKKSAIKAQASVSFKGDLSVRGDLTYQLDFSPDIIDKTGKLKQRLGDIALLKAPFDAGKENRITLQMDLNPLKKNKRFYLHAGSWGLTQWPRGQQPSVGGPTSGLFMHTAGMTFPGIGTQKISGYFQLGTHVDPPPPIEYMLPGFQKNEENTASKPRPRQSKIGSGINMGGRYDLRLDNSFGPFSFNGDAAIGANLSLQNGFSCAGSKDPIGFYDFYLKGNAYVDVFAKMELNINLFLVQGDFDILSARAFFGLEMGMVNPVYLNGKFKGEYEALGGKFKGEYNMPIYVGEPPCGLDLDQTVDDLKALPIHAYIHPEEGTDSVSVFSIFEGANNIAVGEQIKLVKYKEKQDPNAKKEQVGVDIYRYSVSELVLKDKNGKVVRTIPKWNETAEQYALTPTKSLDGNEKYSISYKYQWWKKSEPLKSNDASKEYFKKWKSWKKVDGKLGGLETGVIDFTTGPFPDEVESVMVEHQAPGNRQRYWHKGYANPLIKIKDDIDIDDLIENIFKKDKNYVYKITIEELKQDGTDAIHEIEITGVPRKESIQVYNLKSKPIAGGKFKIPYYDVSEPMAVRTIEFAGMNELDLKPGSLCKFSMIRGVPKHVVAKKTDSRIEQASSTVLDDIKILYEYHFGVSTYDHLFEKFVDAEIAFQETNQHRTDWASTDEPEGLKADHQKEFVPADDYYSFSLAGTEGFDAFDLDRIRKNARISFLDDYDKKDAFESRLSDESKKGEKYLNNYYKILNRFGQIHYYNQTDHAFLKNRLRGWGDIHKKISKRNVGTDWTYQFYIPERANKRVGLIDQSEIDQGKLTNPNVEAGQTDPLTDTKLFNTKVSYDLLFENIYGRLVSNQLFSLGRIGQNYKNYIIYQRWAGKFPNEMPNGVSTALVKGEVTSSYVKTTKTLIPVKFTWAPFVGKVLDKANDYVIKDEVKSVSDTAAIDEHVWHFNNMKYATNLEAGTSDNYTFQSGVSQKVLTTQSEHHGGYHGRVLIEFPSVDNWTAINETKNDIDQFPKKKIILTPGRKSGGKELQGSNVETKNEANFAHLDQEEHMVFLTNTLFGMTVDKIRDSEYKDVAESAIFRDDLFDSGSNVVSPFTFKVINKDKGIYEILKQGDPLFLDKNGFPKVYDYYKKQELSIPDGDTKFQFVIRSVKGKRGVFTIEHPATNTHLFIDPTEMGKGEYWKYRENSMISKENTKWAYFTSKEKTPAEVEFIKKGTDEWEKNVMKYDLSEGFKVQLANFTESNPNKFNMSIGANYDTSLSKSTVVYYEGHPPYNADFAWDIIWVNHKYVMIKGTHSGECLCADAEPLEDKQNIERIRKVKSVKCDKDNKLQHFEPVSYGEDPEQWKTLYSFENRAYKLANEQFSYLGLVYRSMNGANTGQLCLTPKGKTFGSNELYKRPIIKDDFSWRWRLSKNDYNLYPFSDPDPTLQLIDNGHPLKETVAVEEEPVIEEPAKEEIANKNLDAAYLTFAQIDETKKYTIKLKGQDKFLVPYDFQRNLASFMEIGVRFEDKSPSDLEFTFVPIDKSKGKYVIQFDNGGKPIFLMKDYDGIFIGQHKSMTVQKAKDDSQFHLIIRSFPEQEGAYSIGSLDLSKYINDSNGAEAAIELIPIKKPEIKKEGGIPEGLSNMMATHDNDGQKLTKPLVFGTYDFFNEGSFTDDKSKYAFWEVKEFKDGYYTIKYITPDRYDPTSKEVKQLVAYDDEYKIGTPEKIIAIQAYLANWESTDDKSLWKAEILGNGEVRFINKAYENNGSGMKYLTFNGNFNIYKYGDEFQKCRFLITTLNRPEGLPKQVQIEKAEWKTYDSREIMDTPKGSPSPWISKFKITSAPTK